MGKIILIIIAVLLSLNILSMLFLKSKSVAVGELQYFTAEQLKKYDGTNLSLPIYLAMNGYVYDVTAGKEFYQVGGAYHDLAGKDSTRELNIAGGGIIKVKYKIIGKLR